MTIGEVNVEDQRGCVRRPALMAAHVIVPTLGIIADCLVRDFNSSGAKFVVKQVRDLPPVFWLQLRDDWTLRHSTIKWKSRVQYGVEFTSDKLPELTDEELKALRGRFGCNGVNSHVSLEAVVPGNAECA